MTEANVQSCWAYGGRGHTTTTRRGHGWRRLTWLRKAPRTLPPLLCFPQPYSQPLQQKNHSSLISFRWPPRRSRAQRGATGAWGDQRSQGPPWGDGGGSTAGAAPSKAPSTALLALRGEGAWGHRREPKFVSIFILTAGWRYVLLKCTIVNSFVAFCYTTNKAPGWGWCQAPREGVCAGSAPEFSVAYKSEKCIEYFPKFIQLQAPMLCFMHTHSHKAWNSWVQFW